jgi:creatinine amidohydrolase
VTATVQTALPTALTTSHIGASCDSQHASDRTAAHAPSQPGRTPAAWTDVPRYPVMAEPRVPELDMASERDSLLLTDMTSEEVRQHLMVDTRLIVPIGACDQYGPHLPIGASNLVADALAARLSSECRVLRAPTLSYGVNVPSANRYPGTATLQQKTLHRLLNDLLMSWDEIGFSEFILLTVHDFDSHVEAIATVTGTRARLRVIEALNLDLSGILDRRHPIEHGGEALTSLMLFLYPGKVRMDRAVDHLPKGEAISTVQHLARIPDGSPGSIGNPTFATAEKGEQLFALICQRIRERVFDVESR